MRNVGVGASEKRGGSKRGVSGGGSGGRSGKRGGSTARITVVLSLFLCACALLLFRAFHMHVTDGTSVSEFMASHTFAEEAIQTRGDIVSANGRQLATSIRAANIIATPSQIENPGEVAEEISGIVEPETDQSREDLTALLGATGEDGSPSSYSLVSTVSPEAAEEVSALGLPGIYIEPTTKRVYPDGWLASQVVGVYAGAEQAFGGVEARYDEKLAAGEDVSVTLDTAVQQELQAALGDAVEEFDAKSAVGIVMRADDGALIAVASSPTYDNNEFYESPQEVQRDRTITDPYEPGSTMKPFTFAGAIEAGTLKPEDTFTVPDSIVVGDRVIQDSLPHETEVMTPSDILAESSNVGTIKVASALGDRAIRNNLAAFGFGEPTDLDLYGEDPGNLPEISDWSGVSIGNIPIGQGLTVTPMQLTAAFSALVNGGLGVTPHVSQSGEPDTKERVISERTSDIVSRMLQATVDDGTGRLAQVPGYTVGGKTGTSQKVDPETGTYGEDYYASFIGFAPVSDPEFVTLIVVDEPQESIWGESVAAPAFERVMAFTLGYFNVAPDRVIVEDTEGSER